MQLNLAIMMQNSFVIQLSHSNICALGVLTAHSGFLGGLLRHYKLLYGKILPFSPKLFDFLIAENKFHILSIRNRCF